MTTHKRFNRHQIFTDKDRTLVLDMIGELRLDGDRDFNVMNMLYGLFDGYWYDTLERDLMDTNLPTHMLADLSEVLDRVQDHITSNGETITLV